MMQNNITSWLHISATRGTYNPMLKNAVGLVIHVKADPQLTSFIKSLSDDPTVVDIPSGGVWAPMPNDQGITKPLLLVNTSIRQEVVDPYYTLTNPSERLIRNSVRREVNKVVNLSFLRLYGIDNEEGVTFGLLGAYSLTYVKSALADITQQTKRFIQDYIAPIKLSLSITSKDL
jgi:hypothetical protein